MKPPTRKRTTTKAKDLQMEEYSRWTLCERQHLLKALEKYSAHQSSEIAKMVVTKSEADVIYYMSKLKRGLKTDIVAVGSSLERQYLQNIEAWIRFTHQLVDDEEETYSSMIGKLLALYGEYCCKKTDPTTGVNFKAIYDYLAGLMLGVQLPVLPPLEATLVLDLLKNVATFLAQSDITRHKKFLLLNHEKHVLPNSTSTAESKQSILRKLLHEDPAPPSSTPSSSSHPLDKKIPTTFRRDYQEEIPTTFQRDYQEEIPTTFQRVYQEEILSDGTKATVVRLKRINPPSKQTISKPQIQESVFSKSSLIKMKFPASWMKETPKNSSTSITKQATNLRGASAPAEMKITNTINNENKTLDQQNKFSEIPSTSKTVKSGMFSVEKNSVTNLHSNSAVQQDPRVLPVQQIQNDLEFQQVPSGTCVTSNHVKKEFSITTVQKGQNNVPQVPTEAGLLPVPSREIVPHGGQDCTNVSQVPNGGTVKEGSTSGSIDQVPSKANVLLLSNASTLLHFPSGGTFLQMPTGGTVLHLPNGGTINKGQDGTSVLHLPSGSTVQQGPDSASIFQGPNSSRVPQDPSGGTVQKGSILSSLLQDPSGGTVQQKTDSTNIPQRSNSTLVLQDPNGGTVQKRSILSRLLQDPSGGIVQKMIDSANILQRSNHTLVLQDPSGGTVQKGSILSSLLQDKSGGIVQQKASNTKVFKVTSKGLVEQGSSGATPLQLSSVKIVPQMPSVSAERQPPKKSVEQNKKRKLSNFESGMSFKQNKKHCRQESSDSHCKADRQTYKPCISWLNPMNIPSRLIDLTKTQKKRISN